MKKEQCLKTGQKESQLCICDMNSQPKAGTPDPHMNLLLNHCVLYRFEAAVIQELINVQMRCFFLKGRNVFQKFGQTAVGQ